MSADNAITILSTMTDSGKREYRVGEHAGSSSPFRYYQDDQDQWHVRVRDADCLLSVFEGSTVYDDPQAARAEANRLFDAAGGYVECGVGCADVEFTWGQLVCMANLKRVERQSCRFCRETPEGEVVENCPHSLDYWAGHEIADRLVERGWTREEARAAQQLVRQTYETGGENGTEYEYTSDLRLARVADADEMKIFEQVSKGGCCGCFEQDVTVSLPDGRQSVVRVGFNYGH